MKNIENRRSFLQKSLLGGVGLLIGFNWETAAGKTTVVKTLASTSLEFNSYLRIATDGIITIFSPNPEIGQGIKTAFPLVVAEELDCDWAKVVVEQANLDKTRYERQLTGGSGAIVHSWERLRKAGATARNLLIQAAAEKLKVEASTLKTDMGYVISSTGQKLSYGELAEAASKFTAPKEVKLKDPKDFKIVGKFHKGVDNKNLLVGKPLFGIDTKKEGMLVATVIRPPFGMKLKTYNGDAAKASAGISHVVTFDNKIAIAGKTTWEVFQARKKIVVEWEKDKTVESTADQNALFKELMAAKNGEVKRKDGDVEKAFADAHKIIESEFQCPFLPHNTLEPQNFYAHVQGDKAELIGPTQTPQACQTQVAKALGIPEANITVALTKMGGGFGRRLYNDPAIEAANISKLTGAPIKLQWSREDDITAGTYRPAVRYKFKAAIDKAGNLTAYYVKGVGMNAGSTTRGADFFPIGAVENVLIENYDHKSSVTTGAWRAPISNFLAFAEQSFMDEIAIAAGKDVVKFRLDLYQKALDKPVGKLAYEPKRFIAAINQVCEKAAWGKKKKNIHQGFAAYFSHLSYVAQIAEVEMKKGKPTLKKVYAVTDCGIVINQSGARNQIYGAIVDGFGHAMYGNLTFKDGLPQETNFDSYRLIRMQDVPEIEAHFVDNGISPTGLGEPALPPTGGAIANSFAKATGKRFYSQPFMQDEAMI
jgi:isoquinoline 1-oxidoreductase subunit beta